MIYHDNPSEFIENSSEHGSLGKAMVSLSNLEFSHDQFIMQMLKDQRELSLKLSKRFPRQFKDKTNFLISSVMEVSKLRRVPIFQDGKLDLLWLQYQLDELYEIRSIIAHGSIFYSKVTPDRITWTFERFVQTREKSWTRENVDISNGFLASVCLTAEILKHYLISLKFCLEDSSTWEDNYQVDKEIRENRRRIGELVEYGIISDDIGWPD